jgi:hypothetical protein
MPSKPATKPNTEPSTTPLRDKRADDLARRVAEDINAQAVGITPKWARAIENWKRIRAERVKR